MLHDPRAYYNATTTALAAGLDSSSFMSHTSECLKKTYIRMQSALGTQASLEIGARRAEYSLELANAYGGTMSICAIEASPRTHAFFSKNINYKNFRVTYINALVSDLEGETVFYEYISDDMEAASWISSIHIREPMTHGRVRRTRTSVKSMRGDTFIENKFKNLTKISLWIDVEGAQSEVLHSLSKSFERGIINSVYIEVEQKKFWQKQKMLVSDIIEFMNKYNLSPFLRDNEGVMQYNMIFVNNNIACCDLSLYFDYYWNLLLKNVNGCLPYA